MSTLRQRFLNWFSLDTRSLALARLGLGLAIFFDVVTRMNDLDWHYSDQGLVPRGLFVQEIGYPWSFSLHLANGSAFYAGLLLAIHAIAAGAMALGWHTRVATLVNAVLLVSLHNRNWYINNGGDDVIRSLIILSVFLPWGELWSVDQWRRGDGAREPRKVAGPWISCWFLQAFCIYFISYFLKTSPIWRSDFTAIYYSSHLSIFTTWLGEIFRGYPLLLQFLTAYAITAEWLGPLLLVFGSVLALRAQIWVRVFVVALFWGLHGGIIATMNIGLFPYYCLFMWAAFIPSETWQWLFRRWPLIESKIHAFLSRLSGAPSLVQASWRDRPWMKWFEHGLGIFFFFNVLFWNLSTFKPYRLQHPFWMSMGRATHIYQEWNMFSPFPKQEDIWFEIPAELDDGTRLELLTMDRDIASSKRERFPDLVPNEHWRKLYLNLAENEKLVRYYAGAWCRIWNRPVSEGGRIPKLRKFEIILHQHLILPNYEEAPLEKRSLWKHWCFQSDLEDAKLTSPSF